MWDVPRFAEYHNYRLIIVENVVDARHWRLFDAWLQAMNLLDYNHEIVYLNSMFAHPTPQSRDRMYVVFWKRGHKAPNLQFTPPAYCPRCCCDVAAVQSWKNPAKRWGRYGKNRQYLYRCPACAGEVTPYYFCAASAIDWSMPSVRIGDRKQPLKEKTLDRIRVGLEKYGRGPHLFSYYTRGEDKAASLPVSAAMPTQPTWSVHYLVEPPGLLVDLGHTHAQHRGKVHLASDARPTQTSQQTLAFVVSMRDSPDYPLKHITEPLPTQSTVGAPYIVELYGKSNAVAITDPLGSMLTHSHHALVMPYMVELHGEGSLPKPITDPLGCVLSGGNHHGLVTPPSFLVSYYSGSDQAKAITDPMATVSTHDRHGLVQPDSPAVEDCYFRMLKSHEIGRAMAFPNDYIVLGNERQRVKQLGNAVTPPAMEAISGRCIATFKEG